jgi:hypothetical protein
MLVFLSACLPALPACPANVLLSPLHPTTAPSQDNYEVRPSHSALEITHTKQLGKHLHIDHCSSSELTSSES